MEHIFEYFIVFRHTNRFIEACSLRSCFIEVFRRLVHLRSRPLRSVHRWHLKYITRCWTCVIIIQPVILVYDILDAFIMTLYVLISSKHALRYFIKYTPPIIKRRIVKSQISHFVAISCKPVLTRTEFIIANVLILILLHKFAPSLRTQSLKLIEPSFAHLPPTTKLPR